MRTALSITLLIAMAGFGLAQTSITETLRKGIIEEEVNRNLPAAIKQYSAVVQRFDDERKLFAPKSEASAAVRDSYRKLLALQSEYAGKNREAQLARYKLGVGGQIDVIRAERAGIEADLRLAAFDSGLGNVSGSAPGSGYSGSPEARLGIATALYRMAECFRKTGKPEQANIAYARVITEFPEQGGLVTQSRARLPAGFRLPSTAQQEAFARIGDLLTRYVRTFSGYLDYMKLQVKLGAIGELDLYGPRLEVAEAESRLAAWKAGEFDLALRPITLSGTARQEPQQATLFEMKYEQLKSMLDDAIKKNKNEQAQEIREEMGKLQAQADAIRIGYRARIQQDIKQLQEQLQAMQAPAQSTGHWPRAVIEIKRDIFRVQEQLKQVEGQSKPEEYGRRRLQLRLQQLQGELEAAQK